MQYLDPNRISVNQYVEGVTGSDLSMLAQAISLIESSRAGDNALKIQVLEEILPKTGKALKVGITGAPGVGKSTFIEALGLLLINLGYKLAILTVDPSSQRSRGSILGDKTRMEKLSRSTKVFIRPSAAGSSLGGVAHHTRESILLLESAGYDIILVETVGVGQSETQVRNMVDYFLLLMIPGAGDELQGLKKGIIEMSDGLVITQADGENLNRARQTQVTYRNALHYLSPTTNHWQPQVFTCSALENTGIEQIWNNIEEYRNQMDVSGYLEQQRQNQRIVWLDECLKSAVTRYFQQTKQGAGDFGSLKKQVLNGEMLPNKAAEIVLNKLSKRS